MECNWCGEKMTKIDTIYWCPGCGKLWYNDKFIEPDLINICMDQVREIREFRKEIEKLVGKGE